MKIVIDIPRKTYEHIRSCGGHGIFTMYADDNLIITKAIFNGTVEERPQGSWIYGNIHYSTCSNCTYSNYCGDLPFCPNCGADMRGGKNETN